MLVEVFINLIIVLATCLKEDNVLCYVQTQVMFHITNGRCNPFWKFITWQRKDNQTMPPLKTSIGDLAECTFPRVPNIAITEEGVLKLLTWLKTSKAARPDGLHPKVLK